MVQFPSPQRASLAALLSFASGLLLLAPVLAPVLARPDPGPQAPALEIGAAVTHLVISEMATGAASASDEFVELYNPSSGDLALEGLELVYASASGLTVTRKAAWDATSPPIPAGGHLLLANAAGSYATAADATYANGLAATGGGVALRTIDAQAVIDAVAWGSATAFVEGGPAPAPPAGSSLERLPGGADGSTQDTDDNAADFVVRDVPDPQNASADPVPSQGPSPSASATATPTPTATPTLSATPTLTATPTPAATPSPTPMPSPTPTAAPTGTPLTIAEARALPDGSGARVAGTALMGSDYVDGGGCVDDGSGGIAVLPTGAIFARGSLVEAVGTVDDRYAQRTLRVDAADLLVSDGGEEPQPQGAQTGDIGEAFECRLVRVTGSVAGSPTQLSSGPAFDLDDGSGPARILVAAASGIDTTAWLPGATLTLVGVVGQRDSSGTGSAGYRLQPRDPADVESVVPPPTPSPSTSPSPSPSGTASPSASPSSPLLTIAEARAAASGATVRVRGVVTLGNGLVDAPTAVIQDATGAIVLRLGDAAGAARRGTLVEVTGKRSTKAGMETIHTDLAPLVIATQAEPAPQRGTTGELGEASEARLVVVRGEVASAVSRSTAGNTAFTLDDGSGPLRVTLFAAAGFPTGAVERGAVIEVVAVLGQETTGSLPDRGYRLWPRGPADLHVITPASDSGSTDGDGTGASSAHPPAGRSARPSGAPTSIRPSAADLVVPRIDARAVTGRSSVPGVAPDDAAPDPEAGSHVLLNPATALPARGPLAMGTTLLALGLLLAVAWRAGTLARLRAAVLARIADLDGDRDEPPG